MNEAAQIYSAPTTTQTHIYLTIDKISFNENNPRRSPAAQEQDDELEASIACHGILQNIIVTPHLATNESPGVEGNYLVVAGGRRVRAVMSLIAKKELDADYPIPAVVRSEREAAQIAIQENTARAAMATLDELEAMTKLQQQASLSAEKLAALFGRPVREVKKTLALGNVHPDIRDHCRAGNVDLGTLEAFTMEPNQDRQLAIFNRLMKEQDSYITSWAVKQSIKGETMRGTDPDVRFVGIEDYRDAGGKVIEDLFSQSKSETVNIVDTDLLEELKLKKIDEVNTSLGVEGEGWAWVKYDPDFSEHFLDRDYKINHGRLTDAGKALQEEEKTLRSELTDSWKKYHNDEITDEQHEANVDRIDARLSEMPVLIGAERIYSDKAKQTSGVIWRIDSNTGRPTIVRGLKKRDKEEKKAAESGTSDSKPVEKYSMSLRNDLQSIKHLAAKQAITMDQAFAVDLAYFDIIVKSLSDAYFYETPLEFRSRNEPASVGELIRDSHAAVEFFEQENLQISALIEEFLDRDDLYTSFLNFRAIPRADKKRLLTFAVAENLSSERWTNPDPFLSKILENVKFNIAKVWRPGADNFFGRIKKDQQLEIVKSLFDDSTAQDNANKKRSDIAQLLEQKVESMDDKGCWLPDFHEEI